MAETAAIALMSEKISSSIFTMFGWKIQGPINQNWKCENGGHAKQTHPTDVCFWYDDPYSSSAVYINTDLKSYAASSIKKGAIVDAINSLAIATECANSSLPWKGLHTHEDKNADIIGMLFVYNHDGEYDKDFAKMMGEIEAKDLQIPRGVKIQVAGPADIAYLATVANDIKCSRGESHEDQDVYLPPADKCQFFYPNLVRKRVKSTKRHHATLELALAPWQILHHSRIESIPEKPSEVRDAYTIYYRGQGSTIDEFKYLFDYLFRFQLVGDYQYISIRMPFPCKEAYAHFSAAIDSYFEHYFRGFHAIGQIQQQKNRITMRSITNVVTRFSEVEIGMESRHA